MRQGNTKTTFRDGGARSPARVDPQHGTRSRRPFFTGNANADKVLGVVLVYADNVPRQYQDDVRGGIQSLPFNYAYLVGQTGIDSVEVREALAYLHEQEYLRVDLGYPKYDGTPNAYGCHVWLRSRLESAA